MPFREVYRRRHLQGLTQTTEDSRSLVKQGRGLISRKSKSPTSRGNREKAGQTVKILETCVEVENVSYLKAHTVHEHQVAADENMPVPGIRRRKHHFQLLRARLHLAAKARRQRTIYDQLPLQSGGQAIAPGKPRRQMRVMRAIPVVDVPVAIFVMSVTVSVPMPFAMAASLMAFSVTVVTAPAVVVTIVFVMPVPVALSHCDARRKR